MKSISHHPATAWLMRLDETTACKKAQQQQLNDERRGGEPQLTYACSEHRNLRITSSSSRLRRELILMLPRMHDF
jgi:hypothetical protein